ncbi:hypothetical protein BVY04_04975 [bacterium M21]|nr:hypothetical protein BVY04_04975 [bacterium M21]
METYEKWEVVDNVKAPIAWLELREDQLGLRVFSKCTEIENGNGVDFSVSFDTVAAYTVHKNAMHPALTQETGDCPMLEGEEWEEHAFPCLKVSDSAWTGAFSAEQLKDLTGLTHYRVISLEQTLDVLTTATPTGNWIQPKRKSRRR